MSVCVDGLQSTGGGLRSRSRTEDTMPASPWSQTVPCTYTHLSLRCLETLGLFHPHNLLHAVHNGSSSLRHRKLGLAAVLSHERFQSRTIWFSVILLFAVTIRFSSLSVVCSSSRIALCTVGLTVSQLYLVQTACLPPSLPHSPSCSPSLSLFLSPAVIITLQPQEDNTI